MPDADKTVFISYRRNIASFIARAVFMDLRAHGYDVFMDVETIDSGEFDRIILNQIAARAHFLVILTPGTIERCAEVGDWLRREIEEAIRLQRNIVPLLCNGFTFSAETEKYLTGDLARLPKFNGPNVPHDYFDAAMERLRTRFLKQPIYGTITPTPAADQPKVLKRIQEIVNQPKPTEKQLSAEDYFKRAYDKYTNQNDLDGAITDYTEAIRLNSQYAEAYNNRGNARFDKHDYDGAIADYTRSIELKNPELHLPYNNRGNARRNKGDLDGAIADYTETIRLNPQYAEVHNNRGILRYDKRDYDGAIADFTRSIELKNPLLHLPYFTRGNARKVKNDLDGAIADYTETIRLNPQYADAYWGLGNCADDRKQYSDALRHYQRYLELAGNNPAEFVVKKVQELKKKLNK